MSNRDHMAYLPKSVGDYLVEQGCASFDRNSGVYYVSRLPSPERNTEKRAVEALKRLVRMKDDPRHDSIDKAIKNAAWQEAREALSEYSSTTKENA